MSIDYKGAQELNALNKKQSEDIAGKQAALMNATNVTGYDATKTQTLKNDKGTLKWVDDVA